LKDEWSEAGMNDIEGNAVGKGRLNGGREGVSIMKDEMKSKLAFLIRR
jgi:hypothetical protein